jgi:hypothetical protein
VLAQYGQEDPIGFAGVEYVRRSCEDLPNVIRVREHDPGVFVKDAQRETLAVAGGALRH